MKTALTLVSFFFSCLPLMAEQQNVYPVSRLYNARRCIRSQLSPACSTQAVTTRYCKLKEPLPQPITTTSDGKTSMIVTAKDISMQLAVSVSGRKLMGMRLTYAYTIFPNKNDK